MQLISGFPAGKNDKWRPLPGETGLQEILEANDYVPLDVFSPFRRSILDSCCRGSSETLVKTFFTSNVSLVERLIRCKQGPE